jgi:hypothetical protein
MQKNNSFVFLSITIKILILCGCRICDNMVVGKMYCLHRVGEGGSIKGIAIVT